MTDLVPNLDYLIVSSGNLHWINTAAGAWSGGGESRNMIGQDPVQSDLCWPCLSMGEVRGAYIFMGPY